MKSIYIILMNTGTIPSKFISLFTRYKYSHVAISFSRSCNTAYSFGRRKVNSFLDGGFVTTHKKGEFFKKFNKTDCIIYEMKIDKKKYLKLKKIIQNKKNHCLEYKYDFLGIVLRYFYIPVTFKNRYVCSYFVADLLEQCDIYTFKKRPCFVKPKDFNKINELEKIYQGKYFSYR